MAGWESENLELLNEGHFRITDPGPLHSPVHRFSIRRDDRLALILQTEAAPDAKSAATKHPARTVRLNTERVELVNIAGMEAVLAGVQANHVSVRHESSGRGTLKEFAKVHEVTVTAGDLRKAAYTIEWLENLPYDEFVWPDSIQTVTETTTTRSISDDGTTLSDSNRDQTFSRAAAKLIVEGTTLYVCALGQETPAVGIKPGCIVYVGTPGGNMRRKIRTALSFALGLYLIELGHTLYDRDWGIVSATSRSAYSLDKKAFDLGPTPLAPLGNRRWRHDLDRAALSRMVNALVANYETLDLGNLSWAYWHACAATVHIAPAHFGAAIEALQRAYIKSQPAAPATTLLDRAPWRELRTELAELIADSDIDENRKRDLRANLHKINEVPQRMALRAVFQAIGIELGYDEHDAWGRRNSAAHGRPIPEGEELAAIRDTKLLRGLFHRMLLRICNAADFYVDYASLNHPYRSVKEPVPTVPI